jgi:hypothetical protein
VDFEPCQMSRVVTGRVTGSVSEKARLYCVVTASRVRTLGGHIEERVKERVLARIVTDVSSTMRVRQITTCLSKVESVKCHNSRTDPSRRSLTLHAVLPAKVHIVQPQTRYCVIENNPRLALVLARPCLRENEPIVLTLSLPRFPVLGSVFAECGTKGRRSAPDYSRMER